MPNIKSAPSRAYFVLLFALSGFSGLIYESIWTHYLKLFLGHAAFAQSLVLAIFMGGMALGAWLVSRITGRLANLIRTYAIVEALIGIAALGFHEVFVLFLDYSYNTAIPSLGSAEGVGLYKYLSATLLIAPQTILLGMTFPLMAGGLIRRFREEEGRDLASLYFSNSMGAAVGALVCGFLLIRLMGLPGTMRAAGVLNLLVAAGALYLARLPEDAGLPSSKAKAAAAFDKGVGLMLLGAFATGAASFIYEISWVRMLSLVLGASFHAFELMLSAFIAGLAIGGFWIKSRIDRLADPVRFLGIVQVLMGALAMATLPLYLLGYPWMAYLVGHLPHDSAGYLRFNLGSDAAAFAVMLPAAICAGMTLPLFTHILIRRGHGERSIGQVYASNTLGSIVGVVIAVHVLMPSLGLKLSLATGALLDVLLGMLLLRIAAGESVPQRLRALLTACVGLVGIALVLQFVHLDIARLASGVYRTGNTELKSAEMLFHRDGKTASVSVYAEPNKSLYIATNGKVDASIAMSPEVAAAPDEITMVLAAALPLSLHPAPARVANIGFGSGLTSHVMLADPDVRRLDTIEIESAMVEGAKGFMPRVWRTYQDPRSSVHIDDAKAWFAQQQERFDLIISEPSNPWVAGVGNLFSDEFYHHVRRYLAKDGLFVQWLQLYEFNDYLAASVIQALNRNFEDYEIFNVDDANVLIVASPKGRVPSLHEKEFSKSAMREELARVGVNGIQDIELRRLGGKDKLTRLFGRLSAPANSDYYPILSLEAPAARFKREVAFALVALPFAPLPVDELLGAAPRYWPYRPVAQSDNAQAKAIRRARGWLNLLRPAPDNALVLLADDRKLMDAMASAKTCGTPFDKDQHQVALATLPYLSKTDAMALWALPQWDRCKENARQIALYRAIARRDVRGMGALAAVELDKSEDATTEWKRYLLFSAALSALAQNDIEHMRELVERHAETAYPDGAFDIPLLSVLK